ncbi:hypothetical protein QJS10_CPB19g00208 [Acorus calamus]|uniref:RNase H type-1 domain-containing protein n=1 Tax=Acorus calamus TaxID=4465 RepID=A0AAV9CFV0_ACOCL|nr:hypothetical protein QJS10_CPB19g00208 [Acorus calamus]
MAGRVVLIKSILQAIPTYMMFAARLSASVAGVCERMARYFLWYQGRHGRSIHYIGWDTVVQSKAMGGLGLCILKDMRKVILATLAFRFLLHPSFVSQFLNLKYKWNGNPWEIPRLNRSSSVWKALYSGLRIARIHIRKVPGSLSEIDLIRDPWLSAIPFSRISTFLNMTLVTLDFKLSDVICEGSWRHDIIQAIFPHFWASSILSSVPLAPKENSQTQWCWEDSQAESPKAREVYNQLVKNPVTQDTQMWKRLWRIPVPPNAKVVGVGYMYLPWAHPLRMETEAIRLGIQQARALGLNHIRVCSDSNRVIHLLQGSGIGPSSISLLVEAIRAANLHTDPIQFVKVPRAYVMGPDILAKRIELYMQEFSSTHSSKE